MKVTRIVFAALLIIALVGLAGCATKEKVPGQRVKWETLEDKGGGEVATPNWIKLYIAGGISALQALPEYKDVYCIVGEEMGVNKQFVIAWADAFSAQQRIGAMLRTNVASEYQARVTGASASYGGADSFNAARENTATYNQEINNSINSIVNVSYSGAIRQADWWFTRRMYDPDAPKVYRDETTAYVLYTIPKSELNRQVAEALRTSTSADSELYQITIDLARDILSNGFEYMGAGNLPPPEVPPASVPATGPAGTIIIRNTSSNTGSIMTRVKIYSGFEARGEPIITYDKPVLGNQQAQWTLNEGIYTVEVFLNDKEESNQPGLVGSGRTTVGITAGNTFTADFNNGNVTRFEIRN